MDICKRSGLYSYESRAYTVTWITNAVKMGEKANDLGIDTPPVGFEERDV